MQRSGVNTIKYHPDPGYQWESYQPTARHHEREPRGQPPPPPPSRRAQRHSKQKTEQKHKRPHHEKISFLHIPKGADKPYNFTCGSKPMFLCYNDWKYSCNDWEIYKDSQSKIKRPVFLSVPTWTQAGKSGTWTPKKGFLATRPICLICIWIFQLLFQIFQL